MECACENVCDGVHTHISIEIDIYAFETKPDGEGRNSCKRWKYFMNFWWSGSFAGKVGGLPIDQKIEEKFV